MQFRNEAGGRIGKTNFPRMIGMSVGKLRVRLMLTLRPCWWLSGLYSDGQMRGLHLGPLSIVYATWCPAGG